jgi:hypothetical protein
MVYDIEYQIRLTATARRTSRRSSPGTPSQPSHGRRTQSTRSQSRSHDSGRRRGSSRRSSRRRRGGTARAAGAAAGAAAGTRGPVAGDAPAPGADPGAGEIPAPAAPCDDVLIGSRHVRIRSTIGDASATACRQRHVLRHSVAHSGRNTAACYRRYPAPRHHRRSA